MNISARFAAIPFRRLTLTAVFAAALSTLAAPASAESTRRVVSKEAPAFPSEAMDEGIDSGTVKSRLAVDARGSVTNVEIVDAQPKKIFDKAATRALSRWKYEAGAPENVDVQLSFKSR